MYSIRSVIYKCLLFSLISYTCLAQQRNALFGKKLIIEPSDASCGTVPSRSVILQTSRFPTEEDYFPEQEVEIPFIEGPGREITCAKECPIKYPDVLQKPDETLSYVNNEPSEATMLYFGKHRSYTIELKARSEFPLPRTQSIVILEEVGVFEISLNYTDQLSVYFPQEKEYSTVEHYVGFTANISVQFEQGTGLRLNINGTNPDSPNSLFVQTRLSTVLPREINRIRTGERGTSVGCLRSKDVRCISLGHNFDTTIIAAIESDPNEIPPVMELLQKCNLTSRALQTLERYLCSVKLPVCDGEWVKRPCKSWCEKHAELLNGCPGDEFEQLVNSYQFQCYEFNDDRCYNASYTPPTVKYDGDIKVRAFNKMLTSSEFNELDIDAELHENFVRPDCRCSDDYPVDIQNMCYELGYGFTSDNEIVKNAINFPPGKYYYSQHAINDGEIERTLWVATPTVSDIIIKAELDRAIVTQSVNIHLASYYPSDHIVIYKLRNGLWQEWQYFAENCSKLELPNDGKIVSPDSVACSEYQRRFPRQTSFEIQFPFYDVEFQLLSPGRPGYSESINWMDERLLEFMTTEGLKVEMKGLPGNTLENSDERTKFHAVRELTLLEDPRYQAKKAEECVLNCFLETSLIKHTTVFSTTSPGPNMQNGGDSGATSGYSPPPAGSGVNPPTDDEDFLREEPYPLLSFSTTVGPEPVTNSNCQCECRAPVNREKAGRECMPYIEVVNPTVGPEAGGTLINLRGALLSSGPYLNETGFVMLRPTSDPYNSWECQPKFWNDTHVQCLTRNLNINRYVNESMIIELTHPGGGNLKIVAPDYFTYKPNPDIEKIEPLSSIISGGVDLTVTGQNLDSVAYPLMRVKISYSGSSNASEPEWTEYRVCTVLNITTMTCPTPWIYPYLPESYKERLDANNTVIIREQPRSKRELRDSKKTLLSLIAQYLKSLSDASSDSLRIKRDTDDAELTINDENLEFTLGFKLDGVPKYQDLEEDLPEYAKMDYVVDPVFNKFVPETVILKSSWPSKKKHSIRVLGKNMNVGAKMNDYSIRIGREHCTVEQLSKDMLICTPPVDEPEDEALFVQDAGYSTKLYVGNIDSHLGFVQYQGYWETGAFIGIIVTIVLIAIIIVLIIVYCCYKRMTDPHYLDLKNRAVGNPYVGVPLQEKPLLERINPELRQQINETLLHNPDDLIIGKQIGKGNFGKVYSGQLVDPIMKGEKVHVAVKTIKGDTDVESVEDFLKEAIIMKNFAHPNVLPLLGVIIKDNVPYVILPFMENGDLKTFISNENNRFTVRELVSFGLDVAKGMGYLEEQRFVHRDLAARNCMVDKDKRIVIADFGLARDIYVADYYRVEDKSRPLPIRWMAIESIEVQKFTTKSDVWSFGVVLWELLSRGLKPYPGVDNLDIKRYLKRGERLEKPSHSPIEVYEVMKKCWSTLPEERPTFKQILKMLEKLLVGGANKPTAPKSTRSPLPKPPPITPPPKSDKEPGSINDAAQESYMGMEAATPPNASYLELVDMPSDEKALEGYLPMK